MEQAWEGGSPNASHGEEPPEEPFEIEADLASAINYACWQNSLPIVRSLKIANNTDTQIERLRLELSTIPAFARHKVWTIDRVAPGEAFALSDHLVQLDPEFLAGLNEAERGVVTLRLLDGSDAPLAEVSHDIRLLARDEWGGFSSMAAITAAFVMPNDPAIASIMKQAGEVLVTHGLSAALDGYQTGDPRRAYMLSAAIWSAVAGHRLTYAEPPRSFDKIGQKVRLPSTILSEGFATCFDSSLLFASARRAERLRGSQGLSRAIWHQRICGSSTTARLPGRSSACRSRLRPGLCARGRGRPRRLRTGRRSRPENQFRRKDRHCQRRSAAQRSGGRRHPQASHLHVGIGRCQERFNREESRQAFRRPGSEPGWHTFGTPTPRVPSLPIQREPGDHISLETARFLGASPSNSASIVALNTSWRAAILLLKICFDSPKAPDSYTTRRM